MKILPIPIIEFLPVAVIATALSGCQATPAVEASTTRTPVVAPAGSVLRVRLNETLETGRSRPGDRFTGVLDSALLCGSSPILPKGTIVEGSVVAASEPAHGTGKLVLAVKLDTYRTGGNRYPIAAQVVARTAPSVGRHGVRSGLDHRVHA